MDTRSSANTELARLNDAVQIASDAHEHSKRKIADEWARMASVAEHEHGITVADSNRSKLESLVANTLPQLRDERNKAMATYEAAVVKRSEFIQLQNQKHEMLRDIDSLTQRSRVDASLREAATRRGIKGLVHFTRIESLRLLPVHGLLSRHACGTLSVPCKENDEERLDYLLDHISLSISWPNWQLFYRFRKNTSTTDEAWCVLVLHPNVIWTLDCLFTAENAASSLESHRPIEDRQGVVGFNRLFDDSGGARFGLVRADLGIAKNMPTCHQAEVLVRRCVPWSRVLRIVVSSSGAMRDAQNALPRSAHPLLKINRDPFDRRSDWKKWIDARGPCTEHGTPDTAFGTLPSSSDDIPF